MPTRPMDKRYDYATRAGVEAQLDMLRSEVTRAYENLNAAVVALNEFALTTVNRQTATDALVVPTVEAIPRIDREANKLAQRVAALEARTLPARWRSGVARVRGLVSRSVARD